MLMRFKDAPPNDAAPCNNAEKVMHAEMRIGESTLLISDGRCENKPNFHGFALTILASSGDEAQRMFTALSDGGKVTMPLSKTFFSSHFGMVDDRFGVGWMVYVSP
jgi:PhnB protein